ncbi:MAG: hypothetical protein LHW64_07010 [Candidatus Cloacimonetes bacterium]|jgi:hypothetical protein|nr:hypothetical protein [Candidatus Cloacimonadota bacterium]MCK9584941.1 hypothetical protein [Candidatus Cloacimonadota bacterium]MDY0229857.1 hypothetical protein [Candidatus Cloacimonadaceae bacterium]
MKNGKGLRSGMFLILAVMFWIFGSTLNAQVPEWAWQQVISSSATGSGNDQCNFGNDIAVDSHKNAYVIGNFFGTISFGTHTISSSGDADIFAAKVNSAGVWRWVIRNGNSFEKATSHCLSYNMIGRESATILD